MATPTKGVNPFPNRAPAKKGKPVDLSPLEAKPGFANASKSTKIQMAQLHFGSGTAGHLAAIAKYSKK